MRGLSSETGNGTDFVVSAERRAAGQPRDPAAPSADRGALRTPARPPAMVALALGGPVLHLVTRRLAATGDDLRSAAVGWARPSSIGSQRLEKLVGREQPSRVLLEQQVRLRELSQSNRLMKIAGCRRLRRILPRLGADVLRFQHRTHPLSYMHAAILHCMKSIRRSGKP